MYFTFFCNARRYFVLVAIWMGSFSLGVGVRWRLLSGDFLCGSDLSVYQAQLPGTCFM